VIGANFGGVTVVSRANQPRKESKSAMSKRQLIDDIRRYNTTAHPDFLAQFDEAALKQYLEHLEGASTKRLHIASWVRKQPKLRMVS
jgi:hypothetical protein